MGEHHSFILRIKYKGVQDFQSRYRSASDWLNGSDRKPFKEFYDYIFSEIKNHGHISPEHLRKKVDEIIENYRGVKESQRKSTE